VTDHVGTEPVLDLAIRISQILEAHRYAASEEWSLRDPLESAGLHEAGDMTRGVRKHRYRQGSIPTPTR
jgi:hypothetical protein